MPIYYFWTKVVFDQISKNVDNSFLDFLTAAPAFVFYAFVAGVVLTTLQKRYFNENDISDIKTALSSVLLISSKQHQDHKSVQRIREIDPNDYEFHTTFRKILATVQTEKHKVVVVLDNIDRLPEDEIRGYWALVRSIFSGAHQSEKSSKNETITAIVPYDRTLIERSLIDQSGKDDNPSERGTTRLSSRELFSKTFDEILSIAPPVMSNAREFFSEKLEEALPKQISRDDSFRTYRIFTELLQVEGGLTTPRGVVSFVNDASGLYALHNGQFRLPTIAAYLAHQDVVSRAPGTLNDQSKLDRKILDLASDSDLAKNLAAIVFNVEPELAFEVLLDPELTLAIVAPSHEELDRLSKSPGFNLRVEDVVLANSEQWLSTGDFGRAIVNFSKILPGYDGEAKPRVLDALIKAFGEIPSFHVDDDTYQQYLALIDVAEANDRSELLREFLKKAFNGVTELETADFDAGNDFANFLKECRKRIEPLGLTNCFNSEIGKSWPNPAAEFLYGLVVSISEAGFDLNDFGRASFERPDDGNYFEEIAKEDPASAIIALRQFDMKNILTSDDWTAVANACILNCHEEEKTTTEIADTLELACFARSKLAKEERPESLMSSALSQGVFFRNIGRGDSEDSKRAIAHAFFLVGESGLGDAIPVPTKINAQSQRVQDVSDEFTSFNELILGSSDLTEQQADLVADTAKHSSTIITVWTKFASVTPSHLGASSVVKSAYSRGSIPNISLYGLNLYFEYLNEILEPAQFVDLLDRFEPRVTAADISKTTLDRITLGFLTATHQAKGQNWKKFISEVEVRLQKISSEEWLDHIKEFDHTAQLLIELTTTSGCSLKSANFREPLVQTMLEVLAGEEIPSAEKKSLDVMMQCIDVKYHPDIWRTLREKISDVSVDSLKTSTELFPETLRKVVSEGDRIMAVEKDNVIRHLLCPALESDNRPLLEVFVAMGIRKLTDFRNHSNTSTAELLDGAVTAFSKLNSDRAWTERVVEAIKGKKRARSFFEIMFGSADDVG